MAHGVTPYQISSKSSDGQVFVALHWLDEETIADQRSILCKLGYLPSIRFNAVLDIALKQQGLTRSDIYVTQTFHLIYSEKAIRANFRGCGQTIL